MNTYRDVDEQSYTAIALLVTLELDVKFVSVNNLCIKYI